MYLACLGSTNMKGLPKKADQVSSRRICTVDFYLFLRFIIISSQTLHIERQLLTIYAKIIQIVKKI